MKNSALRNQFARVVQSGEEKYLSEVHGNTCIIRPADYIAKQFTISEQVSAAALPV
jgi:hypothetical protein